MAGQKLVVQRIELSELKLGWEFWRLGVTFGRIVYSDGNGMSGKSKRTL